MTISGLQRSTGGRYDRVLATYLSWIISRGWWIDNLRWLDTGIWNDGV